MVSLSATKVWWYCKIISFPAVFVTFRTKNVCFTMIHYFLAFLLISTYSGSWGAPTKDKANGPISSLLETLASSCPNEFLVQQIKAHLEECKVSVPPYNEQQFVCMIFYDINKQLCKAIVDSKFDLAQHYTKYNNEELDVGTACAQAKNWSVTDLKELPDYKDKVLNVFKVSIGCVKVCGVEDVTSQDTNYFCKYLKWGSEVLKASTTAIAEKDVAANSNLTAIENKTQSQILPQPPLKENTDAALVSVTQNSSGSANGSDVTKAVENSKLETAEAVLLSAQQINNQEQDPSIEEPEKLSLDIRARNQTRHKPGSITSSVKPINNVIEPSSIDLEPPKKEDIDDTIEENGIKPPKDTDIDKAKSGDQGDPDYQDSEEGNQDNDDDNPGDPMLGGEVDNKIELHQEDKHTKKIDVPLSYPGERESFANPMPDEFSTEDDHFFPFFLTAVILVVLLYVLYHNKSKVSKVFLGLIVEGRQPGRRRNSRGHAYKRLDTLEQAISASSAAPPSKIIY